MPTQNTSIALTNPGNQAISIASTIPVTDEKRRRLTLVVFFVIIDRYRGSRLCYDINQVTALKCCPVEHAITVIVLHAAFRGCLTASWQSSNDAADRRRISRVDSWSWSLCRSRCCGWSWSCCCRRSRCAYLHATTYDDASAHGTASNPEDRVCFRDHLYYQRRYSWSIYYRQQCQTGNEDCSFDKCLHLRAPESLAWPLLVSSGMNVTFIAPFAGT